MKKVLPWETFKNILKDKNILIGVTGGIAIYKVLSLVSSLVKEGANLKIIMTPDSQKFVSKMTFTSVGNCEVFTDPFEFKVSIPHTTLSSWADVLVIAPATANTIAKIANGFADNLLTMTVLAFQKKKILVPAMNTRMYENHVTLENIEKLRKLGWIILEPEEGRLACGDIGKGRYPENEKVLEVIKDCFIEREKVDNLPAIVTAGPTLEWIDTVRYISNPSSGKMGFAIAKELAKRGFEVSLISGPTHLTPYENLKEFVSIETADEMYREVLKRFEKTSLLVMTAAVADFKPAVRQTHKLKKENLEELSIKLVKNPDILKEISKIKKEQIVVGFAAESEDLLKNAKKKLEEKKLDLIVANDISRKDIGFSSDYNEVKFIYSNGKVEEIERSSKEYIAYVIGNKLVDIFNAKL